MRRLRLAACLALVAALGATQAPTGTTTAVPAPGDTVVAPDPVDPVDPVGGHDVVDLTVDNDGARVGVAVTHSGGSWRGSVTLRIDVTGDRRPDVRATIRHATPTSASFRRADGTVWPCRSREASSPAGSTRTRLEVPRRCLSGAPTMWVRAVVRSPDGEPDSATAGPVLQQSRPNVLMIMTDDMRDDDLRFMPWTRRLIGQPGVRFRNSFAPYPLCCPARASVLTGLYAHNHRIFDVEAPYAFPSFDDRSTIATWLQDSGYATVYVGKYLNGYGSMPRPGETFGTSADYVPPGWTDWRGSPDGGFALGSPDAGSTYYYFDTTLNDNGDGFVPYPGRYQTRVFGGLSAQIIKERAASDQPFFLYVSYLAPHHGDPVEADDPAWVARDDGKLVDFLTPAVPEDVKGRFDDTVKAAPGASWDDPDFSDKPQYLQRPPLNQAEKAAVLEVTRQRAESLAVVDAQVRRTIRALRDSGELDETLVLFTSDNGYFLGEQRMRQGKIWPHEPSLRVPLLMRGPGIPAGEVRRDPFTSIDFAPTIAAFAGVGTDGPRDGVSLLRVARRGDRGWSRPILTETGSQGGTLRTTDESGAPLTEVTERDPRYLIGIRTSRYLYVDIASGVRELYDVVRDPREYVNLVRRPGYGSRLEAFDTLLQQLRTCRGAGCRVPVPDQLTTAP